MLCIYLEVRGAERGPDPDLLCRRRNVGGIRQSSLSGTLRESSEEARSADRTWCKPDFLSAPFRVNPLTERRAGGAVCSPSDQLTLTLSRVWESWTSSGSGGG